MTGVMYDILANFPYLIGKYRDVPALLLLPCAAITVPFAARRIGHAERWLTAFGACAASAIILVMVWTSTAYVLASGYLDHVEPSIAAVSWWYHTGHPMYPDWQAGQGVYGFQYGPLLFQITAAALHLGPSILVSKLPGFLAFWLACGVVLWTLRPMLPSVWLALLPVAVVILMAGGYWRAAYWVRGDPYMLLFAALALWSWQRLGRTAAAIAIGVLAGGLMNLKVHGALYVLPYAAALLATGPNAIQFCTALIGIASGTVAAVLSFLDPDVSLLRYIAFINLALHHGLDLPLLRLNIRFGCVLLLPALVLLWRQVRGEPQPHLLMTLVYCLSVVIVSIIGAKRGAGPTHLIPFLPAFVFLLVQAAPRMRIASNGLANAGVLAVWFLVVVAAYVPSFASNLVRIQAWSNTNDVPEIRREAARLYAAYPAAAMGASDAQSYALSQYKVLGVFAGGPLVYDTATWIDMQGAGVSDEVLLRLLTDCRTPIWIIPNGGAPFTIPAGYDVSPLFSDRIRDLFDRDYKPIRKGEFYSVWACHASPSGR